ncbi:outer membrane beta-barrel protein [Arsenicibacter rosenii]|uniref:Uncharacterized protein n=1 Tax=Arsenicibacter rosenii TaxID=1750698 RepID=A0A1S2VA15_9BACT|nr:outer membrane beta-barrel protein [Arsenicibacter rosenii]OIN55512.1 hypothetical protein BLX24_29865 [Arsenicibacter rosenii]
MKALYLPLLLLLPACIHAQQRPKNLLTIGAGIHALRIHDASRIGFHKSARLGYNFAKNRFLLAADLGYAYLSQKNKTAPGETNLPKPDTWERVTADISGQVNVMPSASRHFVRVGAGYSVWAISNNVSSEKYVIGSYFVPAGSGYTQSHLSAFRTGGNVSAEYGYKLQENFHLELRLRAVMLKDGGVNPTAGVGISYLL